VGSSLPTQRTWALQPLPRHTLSLAFQALEDGSSLLAERLELRDLNSDTLLVWQSAGAFAAELPQGAYELTAWIPGRIPVQQSILLAGPQNLSLAAARQVNEENISFTRTFPDMADFIQTGTNCGWNLAWGDSLDTHFQDSPGRWSAPNMDSRLVCAQAYQLDAPVRDTIPGALEFLEYHELEGGIDSAYVEFSRDNGASWTVMRSWTGPGTVITRQSVPITADWVGGTFRFAFRVKTNGIIEDAGFHLRDIRLSWNGRALSLDPASRPTEFELGAYPNPFNPLTTLRLGLPPRAAGAEARVSLFDLAGREVVRLAPRGGLSAGVVEFAVDGSGLASGVYFARVTVGANGTDLWQGVQRLTLVK
jgi:hypothetical protein